MDETCICGAAPAKGKHAMVVVMNVADMPDGRKVLGRQGVFGAVPACDRCYRFPDQRPVPIKGHFFERAAAKNAIWKAGSSSHVGG